MKKILILLLFVSFNAIGAGTSSSTDDSSQTADQIIKLYELAEKHIDNQSYNKSLKLLKKLTKREDLGTKRADIYNLLGFSYRKHSEPNLDKAFEAYRIALDANPEHLGAHEYLGELYITLGNMNKANEMLLKLETIAGTNSMEYRKLKTAIDNS